MMLYNNKIYRLISIVSLLSVISCSDEINIDYGIDHSDIINFEISVSDSECKSRSAFVSDSLKSQTIILTNKLSGDTVYMLADISSYPKNLPTYRSRGNVVSENDGSLYDEIEVSSYFYTDDESWNDYYRTAPNYMCDQLAKKSQNNSFNFIENRYWPKSGKMRFLAYAPSIGKSTNNRDELQSDVPRNYWFDPSYSLGPRIYVRIPHDVKDQQDLLVAYSGEISCDKRASVPINFQHPLTCIKIVCGEDMVDCVIKKISFNNVCGDGNFYFDMNDADSPLPLSSNDITSYPAGANSKFEIWGNLDTFTADYDNGIKAGANIDLTSTDGLFFMMPQKFDTTQWPWNIEGNGEPTLDIQLELQDRYTGETVQKNLSAPLDGRIWPAGMMVTYTLSYKNAILEVGQPKTFSYRGYIYDGSTTGTRDNTISVNSLYGERDRDWDVEILDGGVNWLEATKSADGKTLTFNVKDNSNTAVSLDIDANLKRNDSKGTTSSPWNLSNQTGAKSIENTANCYMIDAKGTYILPLVYGNAITNGKTNQEAYYNAGGELSDFKNHQGNNIFSPYIQSTWLIPTKAYVVWQDVNGLISDISLVANYYNGGDEIGLSGIYGLKFNVASDIDIEQGNAVIAVEGSDGNIMWSWHIWVTDFDFSSSVDNYSKNISVADKDGNIFNLMNVNLGWCSEGAISYYPRRSCQVKITSDDLVQYVDVIQEGHLSFPRGNQTYYQWGRKDPFVGTVDGIVSKTWYNAEGAHISQTNLDLLETPDKGADNMTTREAIPEMIMHPDKWHIPPYSDPGVILWGGVLDLKDSKDVTYSNLWNNSSSSTTSIKTIYDPCPVGYMVAGSDIYSGLQVINYGESNAELSDAYTIYDSLQILTFPNSGYRDWADNGNIYNFNTDPRGCIWSNSATPDSVSSSFNNSQGCAYYMNFTKNVMIPKDFFYTCDGFSVRPSVIK